jgi:hypothetical protein
MTDIEQSEYDLEPVDDPQSSAPGQPPSTPEHQIRIPTAGQVSAERRQRTRALEEQSRADTIRQAYSTPLLMMIAGATAVNLILALTDGIQAIPPYLLGYLVSVPIGVAVFLLCCMLWMGFDAPIHLIALRLAGIYAVTDVAFALLSFVPFGGIVLWVVPLALYVGLLSEMLEIELRDAVIVGLLTFIAKQLVAIGIIVATFE